MEYREILKSFRTVAIPRYMVKGYMTIRWYQHNVHGSKPFISEKYRLPNVATTLVAQAKNKMFSFVFVFTFPRSPDLKEIIVCMEQGSLIIELVPYIKKHKRNGFASFV